MDIDTHRSLDRHDGLSLRAVRSPGLAVVPMLRLGVADDRHRGRRHARSEPSARRARAGRVRPAVRRRRARLRAAMCARTRGPEPEPPQRHGDAALPRRRRRDGARRGRLRLSRTLDDLRFSVGSDEVGVADDAVRARPTWCGPSRESRGCNACRAATRRAHGRVFDGLPVVMLFVADRARDGGRPADDDFVRLGQCYALRRKSYSASKSSCASRRFCCSFCWVFCSSRFSSSQSTTNR